MQIDHEIDIWRWEEQRGQFILLYKMEMPSHLNQTSQYLMCVKNVMI